MAYNYNFPATFNLQNLNGVGGVKGIQLYDSTAGTGDYFGFGVGIQGDVNGDGLKDLLIVSTSNLINGYIILGKVAGNYPEVLNVNDITNFGGSKLSGFGYTQLSASNNYFYANNASSIITSACINCPTTDDTTSYITNGAVIYGAQSGLPPSINLSKLNLNQGFYITSSSNINGFKFINDINGDGIEELAFDIVNLTTNQRSFCIAFGTSAKPSTNFNAAALNGSNGFCINNLGILDQFGGNQIDGIGDFDGDGFNDLIIATSPTSKNNPGYQNMVYIIRGQKSYPSGSLDVNTMPQKLYYQINGLPSFGCDTVAGVGDVNGDSMPDLAISISNYCFLNDDGCNTQPGKIAIIFGKPGGIASPFSISTINGNNGFLITSPILKKYSTNLGFAISPIRDLDLDGTNEILFSLLGDSTNSPGQVYCLMGSKHPFPASINVADVPGNYGFVVDGITNGDNTGGSLGSGDFDGDGVDDIAIGAPGVNDSAGAVYLIFMPKASPGPVPTGPVASSVYANLALEVYNSPADSSILPPGRLPTNPGGAKWQILSDCGGSQNPNFYSKFYSDGSNLAIAVRGTANLDNVVQDLSYVLPGLIPSYFNDLITCVNNATTSYPGLKLSFTGHSLGAYLAQLGGIKYNAPTVTFEAPGTSHAVEAAIASGDQRFAGITSPNWQNIVNFNAAPDLITMAGGEHKETVVRLFPSFDPSAPVYTLQQHSMANLYLQFNLATGYAHNNASMTGYWNIAGTPKNWPFPNQFSSDPMALNSLLNSAFFNNYDQNPYYIDLVNNANPNNGYTPSGSYSQTGITITGDDRGNSFFGGTNFADTMTGGRGDDSYLPFGGNNVITDPAGNDVYIFSPYNMGGVSTINDGDGYGAMGYYYSYSTPFSAAKLCFVNSPMPVTQSYFSSNTKVYAYFPALDSNCPDHNSGYTFLLTQSGTSLQFSNANEHFSNNTWVVSNFHNGNLGITLGTTSSRSVVVGTSGDDTMTVTAGSVVAGLGGHNLIYMPQDGAVTVIKDPNGFDVYKPQPAMSLGAATIVNQFFGIGQGTHVLDYSNLGVLPSETQVTIYKTPYTMTLLSNGTYVNETLIRTDVLISAPGTQLLLNATDFVISTFDQANFYYLNATAQKTMNLLDVPGMNATEIIAAFNQTVNPSPSPEPHGPGGDPHHSDIGLIAGAAAGGVVGLALLGFGAYYLHHRGLCGGTTSDDHYSPLDSVA